MIDGSTKLVGLIGWPVEHSLSPIMHNAAFEALGLPWCYLPLPVPRGQIEIAVRGLAALGFWGANVTIPHKESVMPVLDSVAPDAQALGAVNTLLLGRDTAGQATISGYNTDVEGFVGALRQGGFAPETADQVVVVGAGGAARAVIFGLLWSGCKEILILNRTPQRAEALISGFDAHGGYSAKLRALPLSPEVLVESARAADLLVHSTTVGMWPHGEASVWPEGMPVPSHLTVFDLVYNPLETRLLQQARRSGAQTIDGLGMLVRQGALAFALWTSRGPDVDAISALMRAACEQALGR